MGILSEPLLGAKFVPPFLRPEVIRRNRLLERMHLWPHTRLILVSAPAGYGKTTLLASWHQTLSEQGYSAAWALLEEHDNQPDRFLPLVTRAFRLALDSTTDIAQGLDLLAASPIKTPETYLRLLVELLAGLPAPCVLILDDYHTLTHPAVHQSVAYLLDHLGGSVKLAIGSRSDPPLPLARLRARGEIVELRLADLRFTPDETEVFLSGSGQLALDSHQLDLVERRAEGWAAGLQLIGLSLRNWPDWAQALLQPGESQVAVSGYLAEEVFDKLAPDLQRFLLHTSILEVLTAPLCEAVCSAEQAAGPDPQSTLDWLEKENLFIIPLDPFGQRYRYHPLFAEFLRACLGKLRPLPTPDLHFRASQWYWQHGHSDLAVRHAVLSGDDSWLAHLFEQSGIFMLVRSELATLHDWLEHLPGGRLQQNPLLLVFRSWEQMLQGRLERVGPDLQAAEVLLKDWPGTYQVDIPGYPVTPQVLAGHITALRAFVARIQTDWEKGNALSRQALSQLPAAEQIVRSTLVFNLGQAHKERHQVEQSRQYLAEAARLGQTSGNLYIQLVSPVYLGQLAVLQGRMQEAEAYYRQSLQMGYRPDGGIAIPAVAFAEAWLGDWYLIQGQVEPAQPHLERAARLAELCGEYGIQHDAYLNMMRFWLAKGDLHAAQRWADKANQILLDGVQASKEWVEGHLALVLLAQGRWAEALAWAQNDPALSEESQITRSGERRLLAAIRVQLAAAERGLVDFAVAARCLETLVPLRSAAKTGGRAESLAEILLLRAGLLQVTGQRREAEKALTQAHAVADPCGWTQIFRDIPVALPAPPGAADAPAVLLAEPLTGREQELLRLIAMGATNQEIAERLYITVGTVKSHLNHLFAKLEARHRAEAIAKARSLGLL